MEISKTFDFKSAEQKWYQHWLDQKYYLRPLGTEGQNLSGNKLYSNQAFSFPLGMGVKYNISGNTINFIVIVFI
jgi:hypothetical protein